MTISIVIVDDHPVISHGLKSILNTQYNYHVAGEAKDSQNALKVIESTQPDVIILDITLEGSDGISLIGRIKEISPKSKIIMYTMHASKEYVGRSFRAGALGYLLKGDHPEELHDAVESVLVNRIYLSTNIPHSILGELISSEGVAASPTEKLTPREFEIASLLARGKNIDEIAESLYISPKTVRVHRTNIMHKFSCKGVHELLLQLRQFFPQES